MRAIETEYGGYRFRSRLEARWAIFFDACGADWEYEPEGYELPSGQKYLPDFVIRGGGYRTPAELFVEVKGVMSAEDADKIMEFYNDGEPVTGYGKIKNPTLVIGNIPRGESMGEIINYISNIGSEGLCKPEMFNFETVDGDYFPAHPGINTRGEFELFGDTCSDLQFMDGDATFAAYKMARQARFEHGETPTRIEVRKKATKAKNRRSQKPTINGIVYESKLDARWGLLFELIGVTYKYHPQGYCRNNKSAYPTFLIEVGSGRDNGKHFVFVKSDINRHEYDEQMSDASLVCNNDIHVEDAVGFRDLSAGEKKNLRLSFCRYYVTDIRDLKDNIYGYCMGRMFEVALSVGEKSMKSDEAVYGFDSLDGDRYPAIIGLGKDGTPEFYGPDWYSDCSNPMDVKKTEDAYLYAATQDLSEPLTV